MEGGPSHIDTFDPKPLLNKLAGQPLPPSFKPVITPMGELRLAVLASQAQVEAARRRAGSWVSDWLPAHRHLRRRLGRDPVVLVRTG